MLPGQNEELAKSAFSLSTSTFYTIEVMFDNVFVLYRDPHRPSRHTRRDRRNLGLDGEDGIRHEQGDRGGWRNVRAVNKCSDLPSGITHYYIHAKIRHKPKRLPLMCSDTVPWAPSASHDLPRSSPSPQLISPVVRISRSSPFPVDINYIP